MIVAFFSLIFFGQERNGAVRSDAFSNNWNVGRGLARCAMADEEGPSDDLVLFQQIKSGLGEDDMGGSFLFEEIVGLGDVLQSGIVVLGIVCILVISPQQRLPSIISVCESVCLQIPQPRPSPAGPMFRPSWEQQKKRRKAG